MTRSYIVENGGIVITGVQDIYYNVQNMGRAVAFYRDVLGLAVTDESPHFTGLDVAGVRLGLHWMGGTAVPPIPHDAHGSHAGGSLTFRVSDIAVAREKLAAQGVKILGSSDNPWGKLVVFTDPDGNVLKLMQPPE
jgi:predicted enzyme related to lactoylglutathione lyase